MATIAYILGFFPILSETFVGQEMRALEAAGHTIIPIAMHRPDKAFQPEDAMLAMKTTYLDAPDAEEEAALLRRYRFKLHRIRGYMRAQTKEDPALLKRRAAHIADIVKKHGCTRIHAHFAWGAAACAITAAKLLKLPVSFTCHGSDVYARPWDLALKCQMADAVFAVAPTLRADVQKLAGKTPCHLVNCGVDTERFQPRPNGVNDNGRWLFTGRLIECKGVDDILAAWALLPPQERPQLDIVGDGVMEGYLQNRARELGVAESVCFLGAQPAAWIAEHGPAYRAFISAFKQSADGSRDTAPMVLKEAMAMGLPIITTNFVDIPSLVGNECAMLCEPSSPSSLAAAIMHVQCMPHEVLQKMGYAGRRRVQAHYSLAKQVAELQHLFGIVEQ